MKPLHEETFRVATFHQDGRQAIIASDGRMVAVTRAEDGPRIARELAALPRLVRALWSAADYRQADDGLPCWCACRTGPHVATCLEARELLRAVGALGPA